MNGRAAVVEKEAEVQHDLDQLEEVEVGGPWTDEEAMHRKDRLNCHRRTLAEQERELVRSEVEVVQHGSAEHEKALGSRPRHARTARTARIV